MSVMTPNRHFNSRFCMRYVILVGSFLCVFGIMYLFIQFNYSRYPMGQLLPRQGKMESLLRAFRGSPGQSLLSIETANGSSSVPSQVAEPPVPCTKADLDRRPGVVVLTTTNAAFIDFTDNWLESIRRTRTCPNITIVAEDDITKEYYYNRTASYPGLHLKKTNSGTMPSKSLKFASPTYNKFVNKRQRYVLPLLKQGYDVLFTDVDTYWLGDPFPFFQDYFDFAVERDLPKFYCAGFVYFKPTKNTITFLEAMVDFMSKDKKGTPDQKVMNDLIKQKRVPGLRVKLLDSANFPNGREFFDERWRENKRDVVVVHNNWVVGHDKKVERFRRCGMWVVDSKTNARKLCVDT